MARKPKLYQKLVRRRGGVGTYTSLWLGPDHVLQVEANMMTERYQRVRFEDIQGFLIRPSGQAKWVTLVSLGLACFFGLIAALAESTAPVFGVFVAIAAVVLLYGLLGARQCYFQVATAVQRTEWANVARRRQVRKILAQLEPLILEAQRNVVSASAVDAEIASGAPNAIAPEAGAPVAPEPTATNGSPDVSVNA